jgi:hypothetical protein
MNRIPVFAVIGLFALTGAVLAATDAPSRKPGYWELTTVAPMIGKKTTNVCIGAKDDIVTPENSGECSPPKVTPAGGETIVDVVCANAAGKQTISTVLTGDFKTGYKAIVKMTFDPPLGKTDKMGVTIEGKYLMPECPK